MPLLDDKTSGDIIIRGSPSNVIKLKTGIPSKPGRSQPPLLLAASGGALYVRLTAPNDTGGIPIRGFDVYLDGELVDEESPDLFFQDRDERNDLQVDATLLLGGLSPNTTYEFFAEAVNDVSSCGSELTHTTDTIRALSLNLSTTAPTIPKPIVTMWQQGATGGGLVVAWEEPRDRGSDTLLQYQVYMSEKLPSPLWQLVYNGTSTTFLKSRLQNATAYLFKATSMNEAGYATESKTMEFETADVSVPGPPGDLRLLGRTGGVVRFQWTPPEDNGGMDVKYYVVDGNGVLKTLAANEIAFGGLRADTNYDFTVFAGNLLGTGNVGATATYRTGPVSVPSTPSSVSVLTTTGGSVMLSITLPADTGGVGVDSLVFAVYANNVLIPGSSVQRLDPATGTSSLPSGLQRRLSSSSSEPSRRRRLQTSDPAADDGSSVLIQVGTLLPKIEYVFTVKLVNDAGGSDPSSESAGSTVAASVPGTPSPPRVTAVTGGSVSLAWTDPVDTGGLPLLSYTLNVTFGGSTIVGTCSGLMLACVVTNLDFLTEYTTTITAFNAVGASATSAPTVFTTSAATLPTAPQQLTVTSVSNGSVSLVWQPPADDGGSDVDRYLIQVFLAADASPATNATLSGDQTQGTISDLSPLVDYFATVRAITVDNNFGDVSKAAYFTTSQFADQPVAPVIGCASNAIVSLHWLASANAKAYRLYRHDIGASTLFATTTSTYIEDKTVSVGTTYTYSLQVQRVDDTVSMASAETSFMVVDNGADNFECFGSNGVIRYVDYANSSARSWTLEPPVPTGVILNVTTFQLECDHDYVVVTTVNETGGTNELWHGGCKRQGAFVLSTGGNVTKLTVAFSSDASVSFGGIDITYHLDTRASAADQVVPCPGPPSCGANGACREGACACFSGFIGEDCSNVVFCPHDIFADCSAFNGTMNCDPVCLQNKKDVIAVSVYGNDLQGTGAMMDTTYSDGTAPKALQTLRRALEVAKPHQTIVMYPGTFTGPRNCGQQVNVPYVTIRGLLGVSVTNVDCENLYSGFSIVGNTMATLANFEISRGVATKGGAVHVEESAVSLTDMVFSSSSATVSGGAVYAWNSHVSMDTTWMISNTAPKGGAVYVENSWLAFDDCTVILNAAQDGAGLYAADGAIVTATSASSVSRNTAAARGGGLFTTGNVTVNNIILRSNKAPVGAGIAVAYGSLATRDTISSSNTASLDGGGLALLQQAAVNASNLRLAFNWAVRNGGGVLLLTNASVNLDATSVIEQCSAESGGGLYAEYSSARVRGLSVRDSSAYDVGGCVAIKRSSVVFTSALLTGCDADRGAGFAAVDKSKAVLAGSVLHGHTSSSFAGGVYLDASSLSAPNSLVESSDAALAGGGAYLTGSGCSLESLAIVQCTAPQGAGVYAFKATAATLKSMYVTKNVASDLNNDTSRGGGLFAFASTMTLTSVTMDKNAADDDGGGVFMNGSTLAGTALTVQANTAARGGGLASIGKSQLTGAALVGNVASGAGGGMAVLGGTLAVVSTRVANCSAAQGDGGGVYVAFASVQHDGLLVLACDAQRGGGIFVVNGSLAASSSASPLLRAVVSDSVAVVAGGGVFLDGTNTLVSDVSITNASAIHGAGVAALGAQGCQLKNTAVTTSSATEFGGGAFFGGGASCVVTSCTFTANAAKLSGGGIAVEDSTVVHSRVTVNANSADGAAGGVFVHASQADALASFTEADASVASRSSVSSNTVPDDHDGANVVVNCVSVRCFVSGLVVTDGALTHGDGAGVVVMGSGSATLSSLLIQGNRAHSGGGMFVTGAGNHTLTRVAFDSNNAAKQAGALRFTADPAAHELVRLTLDECVFSKNTAVDGAGAVALETGDLVGSNLLFVENQVSDSGGSGGAVYALADATGTIASSLFVQNGAAYGGSMTVREGANLTIEQSTLSHDPSAFTARWAALFSQMLGVPYQTKSVASGVPSSTRGGHLYVGGGAASGQRQTHVFLTSTEISYGRADSGGGVFVDSQSLLTATSTRLRNNLAVESGGSVGVSDGSEANLTSSVVSFSESQNVGGGVYVGNSARVFIMGSTVSDNVADDSGGGLYLDTGERVEAFVNDSVVQRNQVKGQGSGVYVDRDALLKAVNSRFEANGGVTLTGKNEAGGAIAGVDANVNLTSCVFVGNTAITGGAVLADRATKLFVNGATSFTGNSADLVGGAIAARLKATARISENTTFSQNSAESGGAIAAADNAIVLLVDSRLTSNSASQDGGAIFVADNTTVVVRSSRLEANAAAMGGAVYVARTNTTAIERASLVGNAASARGGALYFVTVEGVAPRGVTCTDNRARSGGCVFWLTYDSGADPTFVPCTDCVMANNSLYTTATNTRNVTVLWWPSNVTSGVATMEPADEASFDVINATNRSVSDTTLIWPRLQALDLYGQIEVLDTSTECAMSSAVRGAIAFQPWSTKTAVAGIVSFAEATFEVAKPRDAPYALNVSCRLPEKKPLKFAQSVTMLPCPAGFSTSNSGNCARCPKNKYSIDGLKCFDCPNGAACSQNVRRATETLAVETGTSSPRTLQGFYLFDAPASREVRYCDPAQWSDADVCKAVAKRMPDGSDIVEIVRSCSLVQGFTDSWPADRVFACLSGKTFYACDVENACDADVTLEVATQSAASASCSTGYDQAICSVCATNFKRAKDGSCLPCSAVNNEVRHSLRWQNFVIPVFMVLGAALAIYAVRYYLRDLTEIALLEKAEADRRLRPPSGKARRTNVVDRARSLYEEKTNLVKDKLDELKTRAKKAVRARLRRIRPGRANTSDAKVLFGIEVEPPSRPFPIKPGKFKIFIGFFQIFGNFRDAFVIKWSPDIQSLMNFSSQFNLDLVAIAGIDCVITKTFYFDFTVTVVLVGVTLSVVTAYFYAGMRSYSAKLVLIPRNCLKCGLPVLESERVTRSEADKASLNPLVLARLWWQDRKLAQQERAAAAAAAVATDPKSSEASRADRKRLSRANSVTTKSAHDEVRKFMREFGMSQVRTPHLGIFRSVHAQCPTSHRLSGAILERTVRSNLRVWQARVKLRMNYLTYRNKCLKLYCWLALFLYPTVSKTILMIFNCQEIGSVFYLVVDRRIVCYDSSWAVFGAIAMVGVAVWVVGIPFFFWLLIRLAQDRGVRARIKLLQKPQCRRLRAKWLAELHAFHEARGIVVAEMDNRDVQDEQLAKYMRHKNLTDSTVEARLGFIYAEYSQEYWWFEVVDLSRKLFLSGVIVFVQSGSVEQVLLAISVCLVTMWFLLFFQPYDDFSDNLIASVTQLQLFLTLWLGVMIQLNSLNEESMINQQLLSILLVGTCVTVTIFGVGMIFRDGLNESRRVFADEKLDRKRRIQEEVALRWRRAFNFACYERQMELYGELRFDKFSVPAVLEAFRRLRVEAASTSPLDLTRQRERLSPIRSESDRSDANE